MSQLTHRILTDEISFGSTPKGENYYASRDRRLVVTYPQVFQKKREIEIKKLFGGLLRIPVTDVDMLIALLKEVRENLGDECAGEDEQ